LNEPSRLELLRRLFSAAGPARGVTVGIGDDAAVLEGGDRPLVWTVDTAVEGVHFRREWMSLEDIGWRSLAAAASDLAAMGASPRGVLSALILPPDFDEAALSALARGQAEAAASLGTAVVGGNLARGGELSITTTVLGETREPILRKGARAGDLVALAGPVGLGAAGLELLRRGASSADADAAIAAFRRPVARITAGLAASGRAHAGIDISDGLALDASRVAAESGVGITFDRGALLLAAGPELALAAARLARDPLDLALFGGDDYALLMAFAPGEVPAAFVAVGQCTAEPGIALREADGSIHPIEARGFDHFSG
jgi:thiamine-monophosphate kinase